MIVKSLTQKIEYIPECDLDKDPEQKTCFIMRQPTLQERMVQESMRTVEVIGDPDDKETPVRTKILNNKGSIKSMVELVKSCIIDIRNLKIEDGQEVKWGKKSGISRDDVMSMIYPVIPELYSELMGKSEIDEELEKN